MMVHSLNYPYTVVRPETLGGAKRRRGCRGEEVREREVNGTHGRGREERADKAVREVNGGRVRRRGGPSSCRKASEQNSA